MSYSTHETEFALPLPITQSARRTAQQFASQQPTPEKAEQVRLNTLAVLAVHDYLQLMGIDTDLSTSDSWNTVTRLCADVADLEVTGVGRLECRPITVQAQACPVPLEVWQDRIGYVVVQIDEAHQEANLLGFAQMPAVQLSLGQLKSPEDLLDRLDELKQAAVTESPANSVNLSQWLNGMFEAGWQSVESLLNPAQLAFQFRGRGAVANELQVPSIRRAKLINFGRPLGDSLANAAWEYSIALTLEVTSSISESGQAPEMNIRLQAHPLNRSVLPAGLQLKVLDESANVFVDATSRDADDYLQLEFSGQPEEVFSVQIAYGDTEVTESFVI